VGAVAPGWERCPPSGIGPGGTIAAMPTVRMFAAAREASGHGRDVLPGGTVGEVLDTAVERYGAGFAAVLPTCRIWLNGEPADRDHPVVDGDELAVLPPVSGGS
jgi:molybdopterin synthase sulfur carrier subunit